MKNILLIHPSRKVANKKDNLFTNESLTPSLGLAYLAACCRQNGVGVEIIDLRLKNRSLDDVEKYLREKKYLLIGITAFTNEMPYAGLVAKFIKERFPDSLIVLGGPHSSVVPAETLKEFPELDAVVVGEGEETILKLLDAVEKEGRAGFIDVEGIAFKNKGMVVVTPPRKPLDINTLPFPAWDLFGPEHYQSGLFMVSGSRGCPYDCYFCTPNYLGKVRVRNFLSVVNEIEYLVAEFGARKIQFADAMLDLRESNVFNMCDEIVRRGLHRKIEWDCETRADGLNQNLLEKMQAAGCRWVALGAETGNEKILESVIGKKETKEQIIKAVKLIKKVGLKVRCFFIFGHYRETEATIRETVKFALELNPDALSFGLLVPNPATGIRRLAEQGEGGLKLIHSRWGEYNQFDYGCLESEILPLAKMKRWQSRAYFTFYLRNPKKGVALFLDRSGYNYKLRSFFTIPFLLFRNIFPGKKR